MCAAAATPPNSQLLSLLWLLFYIIGRKQYQYPLASTLDILSSLINHASGPVCATCMTWAVLADWWTVMPRKQSLSYSQMALTDADRASCVRLVDWWTSASADFTEPSPNNLLYCNTTLTGLEVGKKEVYRMTLSLPSPPLPFPLSPLTSSPAWLSLPFEWHIKNQG